MKISIKCHDCKRRYVEELDDGMVVLSIPLKPDDAPMLCRFCYSDALFAEPVYWLDRNPCVMFAAKLFIVFCVGFALAGLLVECGARLGG